MTDKFDDTAPDTERDDTVSQALRGMLSMLRRRWPVLALTAVLVFACVIAALLMITPQYTAVARVKIDPSRSAAMGQMNDQPVGMPDQSIVDTEVSVMRSIEIARAVTRELNLVADKELTKGLPPLASTADERAVNERVDDVSQILLRNMRAEREKTTYVVDVNYDSVDPTKAARIANAFAGQYIEYTVGSRSGTAERQSQFLDERLRQMSQEVAQADQDLAQYRARTGVVDQSGGSLSLSDQQIAPLASMLATAESEAAAARSKVNIAKAQIRSGGIDTVSAVLSSEVIRNLRASRAQLIASQGEISTRYGPRHPESVKIGQQLQALDQQLDDESKRVVGGLESEAAAAAARAASLRSDLSGLRGRQSSDLRASAEADTLKRKADNAQSNYNRLSTQAQSVGQMARSSLSQAQIVEVATPPEHPSKPQKGKLLAAGFLFALFAGTAVVCLQELLGTGLRTAHDMRRLGLPYLATTPKLRGSKEPADRIVDKPMSAYAEAFRGLRSTLGLSGEATKVIAILSTLPSEGKTTSSLSLARVMGMAGESVLLIDADLRRAGLHSLTHTEGSAGLVELLHGEATVDEVIQQDRVPGVSLLPVQHSHFSPEDLFRGAAMSDLLASLRGRYDHIIIDTPPLLGVADTRALSRMADVVVVMVKWNSTPANALKAGLELLRRDKVNLLGGIYTMVDANVEEYGAMYYSSKYSKYYAHDS